MGAYDYLDARQVAGSLCCEIGLLLDDSRHSRQKRNLEIIDCRDSESVWKA